MFLFSKNKRNVFILTQRRSLRHITDQSYKGGPSPNDSQRPPYDSEGPRFPSMDLKIHLISSVDSPEFALFTHSLTQSSLIGLDAEWKPVRSPQHSFPTVSLLQLACQLGPDQANILVFLLDLLAIPLPSIYQLLREVFVSPDILKLGFRFKQDLIYLSSTFCSQGCDPGFDRVSFSVSAVVCLVVNKMEGRGERNFTFEFDVWYLPLSSWLPGKWRGKKTEKKAHKAWPCYMVLWSLDWVLRKRSFIKLQGVCIDFCIKRGKFTRKEFY